MAKEKTYVLTRSVKRKECPWLDRNFKKGEKVFAYHGCTYGCISFEGSAFTVKPGETPFFELPNNSVKLLNS